MRRSYYQLDGSFKVSHPYTYSIPLAIDKNEAFPLGFCIAPTECVELYSTFLDHFIRSGPNREDIFQKPLLSDRRRAFIADGRSFRFHFCCIWHLIENCHSNKWLVIFVKRLAFASSEADFRMKREQTLLDLRLVMSDRMVNMDLCAKFASEFGIERDSVCFTFIGNANSPMQS